MKEDDFSDLFEKPDRSAVIATIAVIESQLDKKKKLIVKDVFTGYEKICNASFMKKRLDELSMDRLIKKFDNLGIIKSDNKGEMSLIIPNEVLSKMNEINRELSIFRFFS